MPVILAKKTGFCFGVKRAVEMAQKALTKDRPIYSLGSIIHNEQVVKGLSKKGLKVIGSIDEIEKGVLVISSHGLSPKVKEKIAERGIRIIDTTCPFVLKAQETAKRLSEEGYVVIIVGDVNHPEVKALIDTASENALVVKDPEEALSLKLSRKDRVSVISQTTQSTGNFREVVKAIARKNPKELLVYNTICKDAELRQGHASKLAREVDVMLVVGGRNSANTKRLLEVCGQNCKAAHLVETAAELKKSWFEDAKKIGVTSGASTPDWIVEQVVKKVKLISSKSEYRNSKQARNSNFEN